MTNEYYGVASTPMDDYLAHYGIKGMKWGVRRALARRDAAGLGKQYKRAEKKLAKLEKKAAKTKRYAARAALMGAGAAAAGGLAATGAHGLSSALGAAGRAGNAIVKGAGSAVNAVGRGMEGLGMMARTSKNKKLRTAGMAIADAGRATQNAGHIVRKSGGKANELATGARHAVTDWARSNSVGKELSKQALQTMKDNPEATKTVTKFLEKHGQAGLGTQTRNLANVSNNTIMRVGAGVLGAGLAAGAARNAYKAATAKKKAERFRNEMNKAFAGTQYANSASTSGSSTTSTSKKRRRNGRNA